MKWWDDLWLKEGFANYMSYLAIEKIHPDWQIMDFFSIDDLQKAMELDSDQQSHAISFPVSKPEDIRRIFDAISYSKGASIIRMMNSFLGEKTFIKAIRSYLKTYQYSNAVQVKAGDIVHFRAIYRVSQSTLYSQILSKPFYVSKSGGKVIQLVYDLG